MLIIDDEHKCTCGAYWQDNGYCANGHSRLKVNEKRLLKGEIGCIFCEDDTFNQIHTDFEILDKEIAVENVQCRECGSVWEAFYGLPDVILKSIYYNEGQI